MAVGAPLAEISANGDGAHPVVETPVSGESEPTSIEEAVASAVNEAEIVAATEAASGQLIDIVTPTGGESVTEGTILEWAVKVGETVKQGDTVVEISTDKVDMELPAPSHRDALIEILAEEGETVTVGQMIGRMSASAAEAVAPEVREADEKAPAAEPSIPDGDANASPVARRLAAAEGIDLTAVPGSARGGRITKADVLAAGANGATAAAAPSSEQQLKGASAVLARYMDESRSVPTATSFRTIAVTELAGRRAQLK